MTNERLQELKQVLVWHGTTGMCDEVVKDLIALIDSAMNIQDIKDAHYLAERGEYHVWEEPDEANHIESMVDRSYVMIKVGQLRPIYEAYSALPVSEEVERAIDDIENPLHQVGLMSNQIKF